MHLPPPIFPRPPVFCPNSCILERVPLLLACDRSYWIQRKYGVSIFSGPFWALNYGRARHSLTQSIGPVFHSYTIPFLVTADSRFSNDISPSIDKRSDTRHKVFMKEVWEHNDVSALRRRLCCRLAGRLTWTSKDAADASPTASLPDINRCIQNMIVGRLVYRVSRGVYRFRGVV